MLAFFFAIDSSALAGGTEWGIEGYIVVYGDAAVRVSAVIQVARMDKLVILISQHAHLGGMKISGLVAPAKERRVPEERAGRDSHLCQGDTTGFGF